MRMRVGACVCACVRACVCVCVEGGAGGRECHLEAGLGDVALAPCGLIHTQLDQVVDGHNRAGCGEGDAGGEGARGDGFGIKAEPGGSPRLEEHEAVEGGRRADQCEDDEGVRDELRLGTLIATHLQILPRPPRLQSSVVHPSTCMHRGSARLSLWAGRGGAIDGSSQPAPRT